MVLYYIVSEVGGIPTLWPSAGSIHSCQGLVLRKGHMVLRKPLWRVTAWKGAWVFVNGEGDIKGGRAARGSFTNKHFDSTAMYTTSQLDQLAITQRCSLGFAGRKPTMPQIFTFDPIRQNKIPNRRKKRFVKVLYPPRQVIMLQN